MRHEKKYKVENLDPAVIRQVIRNHPAGFRKIFPDRQINNIYFDTTNLMAYFENVDGVSDRRKFRVRWYGKDIKQIENPKLEIKIKSNQLGRKETHNVKDFDLQSLEALSSEVSTYSQLKLIFQPTLINSYQRSYYGTSNGDFRMTIDWNLQYFSLMNAARFTRYNLREEASVLEVKYEAEKDPVADDILQYLPFRQTKSSKYVTGLLLTK